MGRTLEKMLEDERPEVVANAKARANAILFDIELREIRELMGKTQMEIAMTLGVKQPTVAGMEKAGHDLRLSTLKRYIEAAGGKVRLNIELPNGDHHDLPL